MTNHLNDTHYSNSLVVSVVDTECQILKILMLNFVMLGVVMLSVVASSVCTGTAVTCLLLKLPIIVEGLSNYASDFCIKLGQL